MYVPDPEGLHHRFSVVQLPDVLDTVTCQVNQQMNGWMDMDAQRARYLCKLGWHIKDSTLAICCQAHPLHLFHGVLRGHVLLEEGEDQSRPLDLCRGGEHESCEVLMRCQQRPCLHSNMITIIATMLVLEGMKIIPTTIQTRTQQYNT